MLTAEIKDFVNGQKLGYVATVSENGRPNISPKGTIIPYDDETLAFADIRSPDTVRNIRANPHIEINIVDPLIRRGYMFQGMARIADRDAHDSLVSRYKKAGIKSEIKSTILVRVTKVSPVTSPLYDLGMTEDEIRLAWRGRLGL
ncbi:MAG: pyridoxamine 5'-phosphate oxidase family protein [Nitrosopumilus sp. H13]|nr:MAG: pyridoxamine 5'-phosphate oxidase family protein [Nitrosopumilus sp. H13]